jgi:hypothetical protein
MYAMLLMFKKFNQFFYLCQLYTEYGLIGVEPLVFIMVQFNMIQENLIMSNISKCIIIY